MPSTSQRYYVTQQSRRGDGHVYGARSRFLTPAVLGKLERVGWGEAQVAGAAAEADAPQVDVGSRLRGMW